MTHDSPLVSVIVPSYNSIRTLGLCLQSVAEQTYSPVEVIVVDDGSTDGSPHVARSMGATVVSTGANRGVAVARNLGAERARGQVLFFLDSDVALGPDGVETAVAMLAADPGIGALCGVYEPDPLRPASLMAQYRTAQQYVWFNEVDGTIPGLHSAICAIRAEVFRETGPFNPDLRYTEDQEYGYRLGQRYDVRVSLAIRGRHDHDATLRTVLRKVFQRTRRGMPLWLRYRTLPGGAATGPRAWASVAVLAAVVALPLPLLLGPIGAVGPPSLIAAAILLDLSTHRYVFAHRGARFGLFFLAVHLLVVLTSAVAAGVGVIEYLLSRRTHGRRPLPASGQPAGSPRE